MKDLSPKNCQNFEPRRGLFSRDKRQIRKGAGSKENIIKINIEAGSTKINFGKGSKEQELEEKLKKEQGAIKEGVDNISHSPILMERINFYRVSFLFWA